MAFTGKERDPETGLDYFGARYFSGAQGRFSSPDPLFFHKEMTEDPERWNLYTYVRNNRNNPLNYVDPTGELIELLGNQEQRKKALAALRSAVGAEAGQYLTEQKVAGTNQYVVGISDQTAFAKSNAVAGEFAAIVNDEQTVGLGVVVGNERLPDGSTLAGTGTPGATGNFEGILGTVFGSDLRVYVLDSREDYTPYKLPGSFMSDGLPSGVPDIGLVTAHELGHARARMTGGLFLSKQDSNDAARRLENKVRKLRDPNAATRNKH